MPVVANGVTISARVGVFVAESDVEQNLMAGYLGSCHGVLLSSHPFIFIGFSEVSGRTTAWAGCLSRALAPSYANSSLITRAEGTT